MLLYLCAALLSLLLSLAAPQSPHFFFGEAVCPDPAWEWPSRPREAARLRRQKKLCCSSFQPVPSCMSRVPFPPPREALRREMKHFPRFSKCFCCLGFLFMVLRESGSLNSDSPECSQRDDNPACAESLVAMPLPSPEGGCDGLGSCRLHVLGPEEPAVPEEVQDVPAGEQQMEFKQILKHTGELNKQSSSRTRTLMDRLSLVEARVVSMASGLQKLQEESRLNLHRLEEQLSSLVALLLGILSGCKLPCSESVLKASILVEPSEKSEHTYPRDCAEIHKQGIRDNGIYTIQPIPLRQHFEAYCDMVTDGGGWTVFQRRQDGSVDFNRTWQEYRQGFGSLQGEHWLGNEHLHSLTRLGQHVVRIELEDWHGVKRHAVYRKFKVASEAHKYRLTAREYQGSAGNALSYSRNYNHDHKCFTTWDSDNDNYPMGNCGAYYGAGWWFDSCLAANLNGKYHHGRYTGVTSGIYWGTWYILVDKRTNQKYSFKKAEMKTRPVGF
ncbi:fibroleukin-like isoform X2 [Podarcis raffonei]|uniref:fibroleukin-like isoform X2 n=1 Tax=Podarcis raffonei TaxID=65483 RepID=UPI00232989ED|nr:fibroleukin-like isoform X2 [Podarcis raffonei]